MLADHDSPAIVAVADLASARRLHGETLGLELAENGMGGVLVYRTGAARLVVYGSDHACPERSRRAGTNRA